MRTERFEGTIGATLAESTPDFDTPPDPGPGAPDVLVIVLDDTGFAQLGCFGSDIDTPNIDALAADAPDAALSLLSRLALAFRELKDPAEAAELHADIMGRSAGLQIAELA